MLVLHILQSQKSDLIEKTSHTIRSRCACVWNFSGWNSHLFLYDSIFYFGIWAILFFSLSHASGHGYFSSAFLSHSPYYFLQHEESYQSDGVFFVWMGGIFLRNFQCRSQHEYIWSVRDLDLKSMKRI